MAAGETQSNKSASSSGHKESQIAIDRLSQTIAMMLKESLLAAIVEHRNGLRTNWTCAHSRLV